MRVKCTLDADEIYKIILAAAHEKYGTDAGATVDIYSDGITEPTAVLTWEWEDEDYNGKPQETL